jgi:ABC-type lipoprotein release transport system permease subunit
MKQKTLDLKHFFYIDLSSNEFKKIIKKYKSNKPNSNEHLNFNLIQAFEQQRKEVENKETDEDFMLRDLKQLRKIENELLNNYGLKSKEEIHHIPQSKFVTKLDKSRFNNLILNLKKNNQNNIQYFNKFKYNKKKIIIIIMKIIIIIIMKIIIIIIMKIITKIIIIRKIIKEKV